MDVGIDDLKAYKINRYIEANQQRMINKILLLKEKQTENVFLTGVVDDYIKYFMVIKEQQVNQYNALRKISDYIDNISSTTEITEQLLRESTNDQEEIISHMKVIKEKIDKLSTIIDS